jgi:hypothetical protein
MPPTLPPPLPARQHRVTVFVSTPDFQTLTRLAAERQQPRGAVAAVIVSSALAELAPVSGEPGEVVTSGAA